MSAGDLVAVQCWYSCLPYTHFGVDMGDGTVIELATDPVNEPTVATGDRLATMSVRQSSWEAFARGCAVHPIPTHDALPVAEVLARARGGLGTHTYHLLSSNCEHFARWCKTGRWESLQVDEAHRSLTRTMAHLSAYASSRLALWMGRVPAAASASMMTRILPALAGEVSEQLTRFTLSCGRASPTTIDRGSRLAGYGTVAAVGLAMGGPTGSAAAVAMHAATRVLSSGTRLGNRPPRFRTPSPRDEVLPRLSQHGSSDSRP